LTYRLTTQPIFTFDNLLYDIIRYTECLTKLLAQLRGLWFFICFKIWCYST